MEVTDERAKTYDFTEPYGYIHTALAVRKDNEDITDVYKRQLLYHSRAKNTITGLLIITRITI